MMSLSNVDQSERHKEFATEMVRFLINIVNPKSHVVLNMLAAAFDKMLLTYIFDISILLNKRLNEEEYKSKHDFLLYVNNTVDEDVNKYNETGGELTTELNAFLMSYFS